MARITVLGKTTDGIVDHFGLTLHTEDRRWEVSESGGSSDVFTTKLGSYLHKVAPDRGIYLLGSNDGVVALLRGLEFAPQKNDKGAGNQYETARVFNWQVDSL